MLFLGESSTHVYSCTVVIFRFIDLTEENEKVKTGCTGIALKLALRQQGSVWSWVNVLLQLFSSQYEGKTRTNI